MTTPSQNSISHPEKWFDENIQIYESLAANVANTLQTALDKQNIMYVSIPYRAKSKKSFLKKLEIKNYDNFDKMTDMAGIRVITLVESDLDQVETTIRQLFRVHEEDSGDKADKLGNDKFGYRSRHFVCDIGKKRETLLELEHFKDKRFEIQIRTALAHAWAEIEHDRGYKLEGGLPTELKRRLNIVAALLESADNEFNRLTKEIAEYANNTKKSINNNNLDLPLNSLNISSLLQLKYSQHIEKNVINTMNYTQFNFFKNEIEHMGIKNIEQLDDYIQANLTKFKSTLEDMKPSDVGFIRKLFMLSNPDLYFNQNFSWSLTKESADWLKNELGEEKFATLKLPPIYK